MQKLHLQQRKLKLDSFRPDSKLREKRFQCIRSEEILKELFYRKLEKRKHQLQLQIEKLEGISPLHKLQQGYSYTESEDKQNIRSISQVKKEDKIEIYVTDGKISAKVEEVSKWQPQV